MAEYQDIPLFDGMAGYEEVPVFNESRGLQPYEVTDDEGLPDTRGICDVCGGLTSHPDDNCCASCWMDLPIQHRSIQTYGGPPESSPL